MNPDVSALVPRFRFNEKLLSVETEGFSDADWTWKPAAGGNPPIWILGHVALYRRVLLRKLGVPLEVVGWESRHARGAPHDAALASSPAELLADLRSTGEALGEKIPRLSAAELGQPWGGKFPDGGDTIGGGISFLYFHETYHLGQLGYVRRLLGKPGFA